MAVFVVVEKMQSVPRLSVHNLYDVKFDTLIAMLNVERYDVFGVAVAVAVAVATFVLVD